MGLDMYLKRQSYCRPTEAMKTNGELSIIGVDTEIKIKPTNLSRIIIEEDAVYWCKANQIHNWLSNQIEDGITSCSDYYFSFGTLKELRAVCKEVLDNNALAEELLPTCQGPFFGETDYDEWYFAELEYTVRMIDQLEKDETKHEEGYFDYKYWAWW